MPKTKSDIFNLRILFLSLLIIFSVVFVPQRSNSEEQTWVINLKDADIKVLIQQVSDITGKTFILDESVIGNVTVVSNKPMAKGEIYNLFLTTLKTKGYTIQPSPQGSIIIKEEMAKEGYMPVGKGQSTSGDEIITKVIPLKHASAQELVTVLRPMIANYGHLAASDFSNSLVVVDHANNVKKVEELIAQLDKTENSEMEVVKLKQAWVGNITAVLKELAYGQTQKQGNKFQSLRIIANEYDNSIILKGDKKERAAIKEVIAKLDQSGEDGNLQVIYLNYADATNIAEILKTLITAGKAPVPIAASDNIDAPISSIAGTNDQISIQPDKTLNALVVKADPETINNIRSIVRKLDIKRPQVLIEAAIVEVSGELSEQLGVQFGIGKQASTNLKFTATSFDEAGITIGDILKDTSAGASIGGGLNIAAGGDKFSVLVQALSKNVNANLLSTPSITTLDNQEAQILVGQNVPFITGSFSNDSGSTNPFTTIQRQDIGISLKVTPHIHEGNAVRMDVQQEVSSLVGSAQAKASDLITNKRSIKTSIMAENKEIIVIGGLIQDDIVQGESGIPILKDIPLVGDLFKSHANTSTKRNLFVFLHPTILQTRDEMAGVTQRNVNKIYELDLNDKSNDVNREKWCRDYNDVFGKNEILPRGCQPGADNLEPAASMQTAPAAVRSAPLHESAGQNPQSPYTRNGQ